MNFKQLEKKISDLINENGIYEFIEDRIFEQAELKIRERSPTYDGEDCHIVFEHVNNDKVIYIKFEGSYTSYEGTEWETNFKEVKPKIKTVTYYQ